MKRLIVFLIALLVMAAPVMAERKLTTNEGTIILIPLLVDATDGVTPEGAMTVTNITVELMKENDGNTVPTRTAFTPTASGGNNDMALITSSTHGTYSLELTAAQLNFTGYLTVTVIDTDVMCPAMRSFCVTAANVVDSEYGTDKLKVDTVEKNSSTTAAANEQDFFGNATAYGKFDDTFDGTKVSVDDLFSDAMDAAGVNSEVDAALSDIHLQYLCQTATAGADMTTEVVDNSIISRILSGGDTSLFVPSTDGLQPIRDRGDAVWTGSGRY